jgi:hypothetical protein
MIAIAFVILLIPDKTFEGWKEWLKNLTKNTKHW